MKCLKSWLLQYDFYQFSILVRYIDVFNFGEKFVQIRILVTFRA
jgi:hypothetical protein